MNEGARHEENGARIESLQRRNELYRSILQETSDVAGVDFLRRLTSALGGVLGMDCALIAELVPGRDDQVRTLAAWLDGELVADFDYGLAGTPCRTVVGGDLCVYRSRVQQLFPEDALLAELGMDSYAGVPLHDRDGRSLGLCCVLGRDELVQHELVCELLEASAARASMELERLRAESALRQSEERLRTVAQHMPVLMDAFDAEGNLVFWNDEAERVTGYSADELIGNPRAMELIYPDAEYRERMLAEWERRGHEYRDWEWELTAKDGTRRVIAWSNLSRNYPIPGWAAWGIGVDVTARKDADAARQALDARLQQAQKMEAMGRLAGGVAHEFNNLLTVVLGNAELIHERSGTPDGSHTVRKAADRIASAGKRAASLTQQLLTFCRQEPSHPVALDLNRLLEDMRPMLGKVLGVDVHLEFDLAAGRPVILADPGEMEQVVMNLAMNSRDALVEGGTVAVRTSLERHAVPESVEVVLTIEDDGHGMTREVRAKALDPFYTTKPRGAGTGLGLATVQAIVVNSDGRIELESGLGKGTRVRLSWPAAADLAMPEPDEAHPAGVEDAVSRDETVLVCEDEPLVRQFLVDCLSNAGYRVLETESVAAAVGSASRERPIHVLVCDVILPDGNGLEVRRRVVELQPGIETLFVSGYTDDVIGPLGIDAEDVPLLPKPFSANDLLERLRELCEARNSANG